jgi:hypothetical protein
MELMEMHGVGLGRSRPQRQSQIGVPFFSAMPLVHGKSIAHPLGLIDENNIVEGTFLGRNRRIRCQKSWTLV